MVTLWRYFTAKIQVKKRTTGKRWKIKKNLAECFGFSAVAVQFNVFNNLKKYCVARGMEY